MLQVWGLVYRLIVSRAYDVVLIAGTKATSEKTTVIQQRSFTVDEWQLFASE